MDFIEKHAGKVEEWRHAGGVSVRLPKSTLFRADFRFLGMSSRDLRQLVSMRLWNSPCHNENAVRKVNRTVDRQQVEEAALEVVLSEAQKRHERRRTSFLFRSRKPLVSEKHLDQFAARDVIYFFCQQRFIGSYAAPAAALLGMSADEFTSWETKRRKFRDIW